MRFDDVTIVIPFHNSVHWLELCLHSIKKAGVSNNCKCIVINDRSNQSEVDKAIEIINSLNSQIKFVNTKNEPGYGPTCNYGVSLVDSKYALLLNTDCLITETTIPKLLKPHRCEDNILMTCPISNNSPNYTFDIPNGLSYLDVDRYLSKSIPLDGVVRSYTSAHTVVGNCLLVNVEKFNSLHGFSSAWGIGYGEETDLQYRAEAAGMSSLVVFNAYVYHYGGGSFNNVDNISEHKSINFKKFMSIWGAKYFLDDSQPKMNVIDFLKKIFTCFDTKENLNYDVLFYLPIIDQQIGGIHSIIDICNDLILAGYSANCVLIGSDCDSQFRSYMEYMLFKPLYFPDDEQFINNCQNYNFKRIVSTAHNTAEVCNKVADIMEIEHVQYVQGVEYLFDNGLSYLRALKSYNYGTAVVFASHFLKSKIGHNFQKRPAFYVVKPKVNLLTFYEKNKTKEFFLGFCLRVAQDKGQLYLLNLLQNSRLADKKICIFGSSSYKNFFLDKENITFIELPISKQEISNHLSRIENYIDMSLHEGFGLMAYEALLCGARILSTNSGGVTDYIELDGNSLIENPLDDNKIVDKLFQNSWRNLINNPRYDVWENVLND